MIKLTDEQIKIQEIQFAEDLLHSAETKSQMREWEYQHTNTRWHPILSDSPVMFLLKNAVCRRSKPKVREFYYCIVENADGAIFEITRGTEESIHSAITGFALKKCSAIKKIVEELTEG